MDGPLPTNLAECWRGLLYDRNIQTGDVYAHPVLFPLQRQAEAAEMVKVARGVSPTVVMEIGADKGGGILAWCMLPTVRRVIACEIRGTP